MMARAAPVTPAWQTAFQFAVAFIHHQCARPDFTVYEPFYRGVMGMGVALWSNPAAA